MLNRFGWDIVAVAGLLAIVVGLWYTSHSLALIFAGLVLFVYAELSSAKG